MIFAESGAKGRIAAQAAQGQRELTERENTLLKRVNSLYNQGTDLGELKRGYGVKRRKDGTFEFVRGADGLSAPERHVLSEWVGDATDKLRKDPLLQRVLDQLPQYRGVVYRGVSLPPETVNAFLKKGSTYTLDRISSASRSRNQASGFGSADFDQIPVLLEIVTRSGRQIPKRFTGSEQEVVLPKGIKFKVEKAEFGRGSKYNTDARFVVRLKEVK